MGMLIVLNSLGPLPLPCRAELYGAANHSACRSVQGVPSPQLPLMRGTTGSAHSLLIKLMAVLQAVFTRALACVLIFTMPCVASNRLF